MKLQFINAATGANTVRFTVSEHACRVLVLEPPEVVGSFAVRMRFYQTCAAVIRLLCHQDYQVELGHSVWQERYDSDSNRSDLSAEATPFPDSTLGQLLGWPPVPSTSVNADQFRGVVENQSDLALDGKSVVKPSVESPTAVVEKDHWDIFMYSGDRSLSQIRTDKLAEVAPTANQFNPLALNLGATDCVDEDGVSMSNADALNLLADYTPTVVRYVLFRFASFSQPLEFSRAHLEYAAGRVVYAYQSLQNARSFVREFENLESEIVKDEHRLKRIESESRQALLGNFDSPRLLSALDDICRRVNEYVDTKQPGALPVAVATTRRLLRTFDEVDNVLNLFRDDPASYLVHHRGLALKRRSLDAKDIEKLVSRRVAARTGRDWNTADDIKRQLEEKGVILKDRAGATDWVLLESADVNLF